MHEQMTVQNYRSCAGCSKRITLKVINSSYRRETAYKRIIGIFECPHCGAIQGQCYKGDSYSIVKPFMAKEVAAGTREVYYDLDVLGSDGITRRHGWFDPATGYITQVG